MTQKHQILFDINYQLMVILRHLQLRVLRVKTTLDMTQQLMNILVLYMV